MKKQFKCLIGVLALLLPISTFAYLRDGPQVVINYKNPYYSNTYWIFPTSMQGASYASQFVQTPGETNYPPIIKWSDGIMGWGRNIFGTNTTIDSYGYEQGKLKLTDSGTDYFFCIYDKNGGIMGDYQPQDEFLVSGVVESGYSCPEQNELGHELINFFGENPDPSSGGAKVNKDLPEFCTNNTILNGYYFSNSYPGTFNCKKEDSKFICESSVLNYSYSNENLDFNYTSLDLNTSTETTKDKLFDSSRVSNVDTGFFSNDELILDFKSSDIDYIRLIGEDGQPIKKNVRLVGKGGNFGFGTENIPDKNGYLYLGSETKYGLYFESDKRVKYAEIGRKLPQETVNKICNSNIDNQSVIDGIISVDKKLDEINSNVFIKAINDFISDNIIVNEGEEQNFLFKGLSLITPSLDAENPDLTINIPFLTLGTDGGNIYFQPVTVPLTFYKLEDPYSIIKYERSETYIKFIIFIIALVYISLLFALLYFLFWIYTFIFEKISFVHKTLLGFTSKNTSNANFIIFGIYIVFISVFWDLANSLFTLFLSPVFIVLGDVKGLITILFNTLVIQLGDYYYYASLVNLITVSFVSILSLSLIYVLSLRFARAN